MIDILCLSLQGTILYWALKYRVKYYYNEYIPSSVGKEFVFFQISPNGPGLKITDGFMKSRMLRILKREAKRDFFLAMSVLTFLAWWL